MHHLEPIPSNLVSIPSLLPLSFDAPHLFDVAADDVLPYGLTLGINTARRLKARPADPAREGRHLLGQGHSGVPLIAY